MADRRIVGPCGLAKCPIAYCPGVAKVQILPMRRFKGSVKAERPLER